MGGGTFGIDELVPALDVKYPATPGPTDQQHIHATHATISTAVVTLTHLNPWEH